MSTPRALITGVTGQDGSYLAEIMLNRGYEVHGVVRRSSSFNTARVERLIEEKPDFHWHFGDLTDGASLRRLLEKTNPSVVYNLGAQSHVRVSFDVPEYTADTVAMGTLRLLEAIKDVNKSIRFYQASSSEMFGGKNCPPGGFHEESRFDPQSPYAVAKVFAYNMTRHYREAHGLFACNGILFNHESPRRGETFVTRKITRAVARIVAGKQKNLELGNIDAIRDWGHAWDYARAMVMMMHNTDTPSDYVVASGETHSVRGFLEAAFSLVGLDWEKYVIPNCTRYFRPTEVFYLLGNSGKIRHDLGWNPLYTFKDLVHGMVYHDCRQEGLDVPKSQQCPVPRPYLTPEKQFALTRESLFPKEKP